MTRAGEPQPDRDRQEACSRTDHRLAGGQEKLGGVAESLARRARRGGYSSSSSSSSSSSLCGGATLFFLLPPARDDLRVAAGEDSVREAAPSDSGSAKEGGSVRPSQRMSERQGKDLESGKEMTRASTRREPRTVLVLLLVVLLLRPTALLPLALPAPLLTLALPRPLRRRRRLARRVHALFVVVVAAEPKRSDVDRHAVELVRLGVARPDPARAAREGQHAPLEDDVERGGEVETHCLHGSGGFDKWSGHCPLAPSRRGVQNV